MSQTNNEVFAILKSYNDSISPRRLILLEEATANPALNTKWLSNFNLIRSFILSRWGGEETPCTFARVQQAVSSIHKSNAGLLHWCDGKAPGMARDTEKPKDNVANSQADLIERQEADRKAKVDATTLSSAHSRCANYDVQPHSVKFDRRKRFLAVFDRLKNSGISAEEVSKGVDLAILDTEKGATAESVFRTVDEFINGLKNPKTKAAARRVIGV
jgi:hypothetical protein